MSGELIALEYLRELVALTGPSGTEQDVIQAIARLARPLADTIELDALGNLIVVRQAADAQARRCVLAAHMDEIGFRVRAIEPDGFLRFEKVGGSDNRVLLGQRVWVRANDGRILGVIGTPSVHLQKEPDRAVVPAHTSLYIDIGARDTEQAVGMGVKLGDAVGFIGELAELGRGSGRYTAHALDDRMGCAVLLALLARFAEQRPPATITAVFTVQEEVGLRGAQAAIKGQQADVGLAVDTTACDDVPEFGTNALRLGAGPTIKIMDFSLQAHPAVRRGLEQAADRASLPVQQEILSGIGTDAGALQFGGHGIPAGVVSLGTRYTHSPVEVFDAADLDAAVTLFQHFIELLPEMDLRFTILE
jgi:endoglucanase